MRPLAYDLHLHSCLSPCGDEEMTPNSIAGMGKLNGLSILALTDHNTTANAAAFYAACQRYGIVPIAGAELTTAEDIHLVSLFPTLEAALDFDADLAPYRIAVPNRPEIFGHQLLVDENDEVLGERVELLTNALSLSLDEAAAFAGRYGAVCYPAHIDRESNGAVAVLGAFPHESGFTCYELASQTNLKAYESRYALSGLLPIVSSDAHVLWNISEGENTLLLSGESEAELRAELLTLLKGGGA